MLYSILYDRHRLILGTLGCRIRIYLLYKNCNKPCELEYPNFTATKENKNNLM